MVWSPVPVYCFIRGLWQWLVHKWRCLNFSCSFTLLLTVKLMCPCRPLDKHAVAVNALHFWGSHCLRHVVLGRNVVFPGETQGDGEEPVCLLCQPLKCSGQWNPSHKVPLGTGPSLPASIFTHLPTFLMIHGIGSVIDRVDVPQELSTSCAIVRFHTHRVTSCESIYFPEQPNGLSTLMFHSVINTWSCGWPYFISNTGGIGWKAIKLLRRHSVRLYEFNYLALFSWKAR